MPTLSHLFENNRRWAAARTERDQDFFSRLSRQQAPEYLWIGCSDSRVPANEIVGLDPGELFVHRNVANVVSHTDLNCLSVLQYAVDVLHVKHVIVCGHYGCGGVQTAMDNRQFGLIDNWLRQIKDLYAQQYDEIHSLASPAERLNRMCELNVAHQVRNLCHATIVQNAWSRDQPLTVHGWIYDIHDGLLRDLEVAVRGVEEINRIYRMSSE